MGIKKKAFALRLSDSRTFSALKKIADTKRWSVNTLIDSVVKDYVKNVNKL